jgi:hypothetical protein
METKLFFFNYYFLQQQVIPYADGHHKQIRDLMIQYLKDPVTQEGVIANLHSILAFFGRLPEDQKVLHLFFLVFVRPILFLIFPHTQSSIFPAFLQPLLDTQLATVNNWRLQSKLIENFQNLHLYFPAHLINEKVIPMLVKLMHNVTLKYPLPSFFAIDRKFFFFSPEFDTRERCSLLVCLPSDSKDKKLSKAKRI